MTDLDLLITCADVPASIAEIVVRMAGEAKLDLSTLRGSSTLPSLCAVRRRIIVAARSVQGPPRKFYPRGGPYSYWVIGRALNRDHSSIIEAERRAHTLLKEGG